MTSRAARMTRWTRRVVQFIFFALFMLLFLRAGNPNLPNWTSYGLFIVFDPFLFILNLAATKKILTIAAFSIAPLALTMVLGRFFCGWLCPMGAIREMFSWIVKARQEALAEPDRRLLRTKYLILVFSVAGAVLGTSAGTWLDPFALLSRTSASAIDWSVGGSIGSTSASAAHSVQSVLIGSIFLFFIVLNASRRRFFCNGLCPLGAFYGLAARFSFFGLKPREDCRTCRACASHCPYGGGPGRHYLKSECTLCFNCAAECPNKAVVVEFSRPKTAGRSSFVDLGRRRLLGTAALGAAAAALPRKLIQPGVPKRRRYLRPPGSVREKDFLSRCLRCGQCVKACPTSFIQPALFEAGVEGLWTPVLDPGAGACDYECRRCTIVCPSRAIETLTLDEKKRFKIGTAIVDKSLCLTYADGINCTACQERCPIPEKAIRFRPIDAADYRGRTVLIRQIYVVPDLCTGCGICQNVCPRDGSPGIFIIPEDEAREAPSTDF